MYKELGWASANLSGAVSLSRHYHRRKVLILMYHAVVDDDRPYRKWTHLSTSEFERQVRFLCRRYTVLPLPRVVQAMASGERLPKHTAVITLDDGYRNNYTRAFPILVRHEAPATIFLTTGLVGAGAISWTSQLYLAIRSSTAAELDLRDIGGARYRLGAPNDRESVTNAILEWTKSLDVSHKDQIVQHVRHKLKPTCDQPLKRLVGRVS